VFFGAGLFFGLAPIFFVEERTLALEERFRQDSWLDEFVQIDGLAVNFPTLVPTPVP
jgi:hypothetical protein